MTGAEASASNDPAVGSGELGRSETLVAARNAVTLGSSLALTGGLALVIRLLIPRFLGPGSFGELRLAESFAEMLFVVLTFGVDTQLRLEAAVDPSKARNYLCGVAAIRLALGAVGIAGAIVLLKAIGSSERVIVLFALVAVAQTFLVLNNTYAAYEHAAGDLKWLARTNFAIKALWAALMIVVLFRAASGLAIAATALSIEVLRLAWFTWRAVRRHKLSLRPDMRLAGVAVLASFPIFLNSVTHNLYARIGIGWLAARSGDFEVGLYGAASNVVSVALIGLPLVSWVLVPSAARAAANSAEEVTRMVAGSLRVSLLVGVPLALVFHVTAGFVLKALFGADFQAAAPVLQAMAPTVGLTYMSTICAIALIQQNRTWTVVAVSLLGAVATVLFAGALIPWGARALGPAGGAQGAAWAALATEVVVTVALAMISRASWFEARLLRTVAALAAGVAGAIAVSWMFSLGGVARPIAAAVAFVAIALACRVVDRQDVAFCREILSRRRRTEPVLSLEAS